MHLTHSTDALHQFKVSPNWAVATVFRERHTIIFLHLLTSVLSSCALDMGFSCNDETTWEER